MIVPINNAPHYIGRFAPSPTGPLHFGSLFTALASFLEARAQQGKWLLRIDDLDTPRNVAGSIAAILKTLEALGLHWDDQVLYQSAHRQAYQDFLHDLEGKQLLYRCTCSRKFLSSLESHADIYPGHCRNTRCNDDIPHALRIKTEADIISFHDQLQGWISHDIAGQHGDFILKRKDDIVAYQFAVVIDDHLQQISHVVRGIDLLESTPKQIYLQQKLGFTTPDYLHAIYTCRLLSTNKAINSANKPTPKPLKLKIRVVFCFIYSRC
ncbi:MAG: tRNA glutamyl-Q(34) synthetase GluQRS [Methylococcales bacterium]